MALRHAPRSGIVAERAAEVGRLPAAARRRGTLGREARSAGRTGSRAAGRRGPAPRPGSRPAGRPARARAARSAGPPCRDDAGRANRPATSCSSTCWPAYCTTTRSAVSATTPMSWVMSTSAMPRSRCRSTQQVEDLRLDGHVERRGRLVGDQQLRVAGDRHGDHHPLAHAARHLVREGAEPLLRRRDADLAQQLDRRARRAARGPAAEMDAQRLVDLEADREAGVEAGHRLLEDHRHVLADDLAPALRGRQAAAGRGPSKAQPVGGDLRRPRQQAHDRQHRHRLARARTRRRSPATSPRLDVEVDAVDGAERAAGGRRTRPRGCGSRAGAIG